MGIINNLGSVFEHVSYTFVYAIGSFSHLNLIDTFFSKIYLLIPTVFTQVSNTKYRGELQLRLGRKDTLSIIDDEDANIHPR
jgi:hypothetical protein